MASQCTNFFANIAFRDKNAARGQKTHLKLKPIEYQCERSFHFFRNIHVYKIFGRIFNRKCATRRAFVQEGIHWEKSGGNPSRKYNR